MTRDERAFAISMVNRYTHRPYMNAEVLEYLQLRYIQKECAFAPRRRVDAVEVTGY